MKKFLTLALCVAAIGSLSAQKTAVDQAKKLASKDLGAARELLKGAMQNPETANSADTYFIAGDIEFDNYTKGADKLKTNPDDSSVDKLGIDNSLLAGYDYFIKALPLDSLPNEKGQTKPKYSKKIIDKINMNANNFFAAGADFYDNKKYYPEAYNAFMIYGNMPEWKHVNAANKALIPDTIAARAYFYAGLSAFSGNALKEAADAFRLARTHNYTEPEACIYEIACWQNISNNDSTMGETAKVAIDEIARDGYKRFGMAQPIFFNNMVNTLVTDNKYDDALAMVSQAISEYPSKPSLYGLRGFVYDRMGNDDASIADYLQAADMPDTDYETLKNASKKIFKVGTQILSTLEGVAPETLAKKKELKTNYFEKALEIANKARKMNSSDSDLDYVLDSIDYALSTYFTGIN